jgi:phospholipid transport system substrate-binding protein
MSGDGMMRSLVTGRRGLLVFGGAALGVIAISAPAAADDPVLVPAHQLIAGLLQVMKAGSAAAPFASRYDILAPVIDETFDLTAILSESVGPATWEATPPDQQKALMEAFRRYTVSSYVSSFNEFNGQRFVINPETRSVGNEEVVETKIIPMSGDGHELSYVMRQTSAGWRIVDVLADGSISRVAVQRSDFRRQIREGGAEALSRSLKIKANGLWN